MRSKSEKLLDTAYAALTGRLATMTSEQLADATADRLARSYGVPIAGALSKLNQEIGRR